MKKKKGYWKTEEKGMWCEDWGYSDDNISMHTDPTGPIMCTIPKEEHVKARVQVWEAGK